MRVHYISPSTLPSRTANSVHVVWQCDGLVRAGASVTLYAKRSVEDAAELPQALEAAYGIDARRLTLATFFSRHAKADSLRIAAMAVKHLRLVGSDAVIVSRNLYASFVLGVIQRRPLVFETHQLEQGIRRTLQRALVTRPWVSTVLVSRQLEQHLSRHLGATPRRMTVLHDAAPDGIVPVSRAERRALRAQAEPESAGNWDLVCGYFGHLYRGRGMEVLRMLAASRPGILFLVYGGNDSDVDEHRAGSELPNLKFRGHVSHPDARRFMTLMDVLLMPYQRSVSIGVEGHDTAGWMSPMKMFEYLASGVPVIASDLPSLHEVLEHERNCLMVPPEDAGAWLDAIDRLAADHELAGRLGAEAHALYRNNHTWTRRAEALLEAARRP